MHQDNPNTNYGQSTQVLTWLNTEVDEECLKFLISLEGSVIFPKNLKGPYL